MCARLIRLTLLLGLAITFAGCTTSPAPPEEAPLVTFEALYTLGDPHVEQDADADEIVFGSIRALRVDRHGNLYVLDTGMLQVLRFGPDGILQHTIQLSQGQGPGEIGIVIDLAVDDDLNLVLLDQRMQAVHVYDAGANFVRSFPTRFMPTGLEIAPDGGLYVTSYWFAPDSSLHLFSREGEKVRSLLARPDHWESLARSGAFPRMVAGPAGSLLYSLPFPYDVVELGSDGRVLREAAGQPAFTLPVEVRRIESGQVTEVVNELSRGLAVLPDGHVLNLVEQRRPERDDVRSFLDVFTPDLRFVRRIPATELGFERILHIRGGVDESLYVSPVADVPVVAKFRIEIG